MIKNLEDIKAVIEANHKERRTTFAGLKSAEIGAYNHSLMFGENDEAMPDESTLSAWID